MSWVAQKEMVWTGDMCKEAPVAEDTVEKDETYLNFQKVSTHHTGGKISQVDRINIHTVFT